MKNTLTYSQGAQSLLANMNDGTNRILINGVEIPSSDWTGTGTFTYSVEGATISIQRIADTSGNIMLQKVETDSYRLVRKTVSEYLQSFIGMVVESTTLATLADVQSIYGVDTTWIQHTGYILRGADSGVLADTALNDGGQDAITPTGTNTGGSVGNHKLTTSEMPKHTHTFTGTAVDTGDNNVNHTHTTPNHTHDIKTASPNNTGSFSTSQVEFGRPTGTTYTNDNMFSSSGGGTTGQNSAKHHHSVTAKGTNSDTGGDGNHNHPFTQPTFTGDEHTNLPKYKNIYIWERTA